MKYIRTEEKILEVTFETPLGFEGYLPDYSDTFFVYKGHIIYQADTIEELCDYWVFIKDNEKPLIKDLFSKEYCKEKYYDNGYICLLVIWTDKGLIYVAKMNEKGELELL